MRKHQLKPLKDNIQACAYTGCQYKCHDGYGFCIYHIPLEEKRQNSTLANHFKIAFETFFEGEVLKDKAGNFMGFELPDGLDLSSRDFRCSYERRNPKSIPLEGSRSVNFGNAKFGNAINFSRSIFGDDASFYKASLGNEVNFNQSIFGDFINFSDATFGNETSFVKSIFGFKADFGSAHFGSITHFWDVRFGDAPNFFKATFKDKAGFVKATFGKNTKFIRSEFGDNANFSLSKFGEAVSFSRAKFEPNATFSQAMFGDNAFFSETEFHGNSTFYQAVFGDNAYFGSSIFDYNAEFKGVIFGDETKFSKAKFYGAVDFSEITTSETVFRLIPSKSGQIGFQDGVLRRTPDSVRLLFKDTKFQGFSLFQGADLSRMRFELVDLQNLSFFKSRISQTEFVSCSWGSGPESRKHWHRSSGFNLGFRRPRLLLDELIWRKQNQKPASKIPYILKPFSWLWGLHIAAYSRVPEIEAIDEVEYTKDLQAEDIEILGLQLKQSLEATRDPITAGDFHFAVMEMKLEKARRDKRRIRALGLSLYKLINGYGERYARTLMWLALLVAISTLLFAWQGETLFKGYATFSNRLEPAFFWACQHILPFKFGTELWAINVKDSAIRWLTMGETFMGSTLFAFMILAMRRRFKR